MGAVTYKNREFQERVVELCQECLDDPARSIYVKPRTMKKSMREDFPDMTDNELGNNIGRVLNGVPWTERWGGEAYRLLSDEM